jgi:hypothetical protein
MITIKLPKDYIEKDLANYRFKSFIDYTKPELSKFTKKEIDALADISSDYFGKWRTDSFEFLQLKDKIESKLNKLGYTLCIVFKDTNEIGSFRVIKTKNQYQS